MKMPISMFCPPPPEPAPPVVPDDVADAGELLPVSLVAALPLFEVPATLPW